MKSNVAVCFDCYIAGPKMRLILIRKCSIKETPEIFKELEHTKNIVLIVYFFSTENSYIPNSFNSQCSI